MLSNRHGPPSLFHPVASPFYPLESLCTSVKGNSPNASLKIPIIGIMHLHCRITPQPNPFIYAGKQKSRKESNNIVIIPSIVR